MPSAAQPKGKARWFNYFTDFVIFFPDTANICPKCDNASDIFVPFEMFEKNLGLFWYFPHEPR